MWAEPLQIYFKTAPAEERLRPLGDAIIFSVLVTAADGKPLTEGWADIRLDAPPPGRFLSTDFPLVEGTRLGEMRLPLTGRRLEWKYSLPIRGDYRLSVDVVQEGKKIAGKTFQFDVRENRNRWIFLTIFVLALFALGVIAGRIFSPPARSVRDRSLIFVLCLAGGFTLSGRIASAQDIGLTHEFAGLEVEPAAVGKMSLIRWRIEGDQAAAKAMSLLTLSVIHKEKEKTVFAIERIPVVERFEMAFHFTDAADYRVTASAAVPGRGIVRLEKNVSVSGAEPSMMAQLPAMAFFLAVVAAGLAVGRWSRRAIALNQKNN